MEVLMVQSKIRAESVTAVQAACRAARRGDVDARRLVPVVLRVAVRGAMTDRERLLDELRPAAFAIAYRMLGSVSEAEDVVQEALLRVHQALDGGEMSSGAHCSLR
jgi:Sigma-70 region 2